MCIWTGFLDNQIAWLPVHKDYKNIILCVCVFSQRPCLMAQTMKQFCMKDFISQGRENVLFLPSNEVT